MERKGTTVNVPSELTSSLNDNSVFQDAFNLLTTGKQREYVEYIDSAKREETKLSRTEKIKPMVLKGIGLNDKYKNC